MHRIFALFVVASFVSCHSKTQVTPLFEVPPIIPVPVKMEMSRGYFTFSERTKIAFPKGEKDFEMAARYLSGLLQPATGWALPVVNEAAEVQLQKDLSIAANEAYQLDINPKSIVIRARTGAGAFYAIQTLRQLLPPQIESLKPVGEIAWTAPALSIFDKPRFSYRGLHLDVGRHFFSVEFVKKYIDLLALHKMNRFHWHLTDDQGWRIEIKKYPRLQEVAAWRKETLVGHYNDYPNLFDGTRYGGFYTQEEVKEVVRYASERFITVVPEIEMPGHAQAALAAYPEFSCNGAPIEVATKWGVFDEVFCPKEATFQFLEDVLTEVMALFPGEYIHVGGDECPKTRWKSCLHCQSLMRKEGLKDEYELQSYFIRRIERFLNKNGRKLIGWDEILEGGLAPNATVMSWRGTEGGMAAARQGHDVIMTPGSHCYFDYYQSQAADEPLAIGGFITVEKVYSFEPVPAELTPGEARHILGAQGNVWTEYLPLPENVEYMAYPRAIALAEVLWSPRNHRNYSDFVERLSRHFQRLDILNVNYANHVMDVVPTVEGAENGILLRLSTLADGAKIFYKDNGGEPSPFSNLYQKPILLLESKTIKAAAFRGSEKISRTKKLTFNVHKAAGKSVELAKPPHPNYSAGGKQALVNGIAGSDDRYGDGEWLGWLGEDFVTTIDLGKKQPLGSATLRFFNGRGQWIYLPRKVEIFLSDDGQQFAKVADYQDFKDTFEKVVAAKLAMNGREGRFVKVVVSRYGIIPEGAAGAGHEAWLFVDEVVVE